MKKTLIFCQVLVLCSCLSVISRDARAASAAEQRYVDAYLLIEQGEAAEKKSDWELAQAKFSAALDILQEVKAKSPDWNPQMVDYRIRYCNSHLAAVKSRSAVTPVAAPVQQKTETPSVVTPPVAASPPVVVASAAVAAETKPASELNSRVEKLTQENKQLSSQLADAQKQLGDLKKQLAAKPAPSDSTEVKKLRSDVAAAKADA